MNSLYDTIFITALCLLPPMIASALYTTLQALGRLRGKEEIENKTNLLYLLLQKHLKSIHFWETTLFAVQMTRIFYYLVFAAASLHLFYTYFSSYTLILIPWLLGCLTLELSIALLCERRPEKLVRVLLFFTSLFMLPYTPFILCYTRLRSYLIPQNPIIEKLPSRLKDDLPEYVSQSELGRYLEKAEVKLIQTTISFKSRIVREVMVPRVDMFTLPSSTTIQEAARYFSSEGYSRIPIYKENVDKIIGILLHKDVLSVYSKHLEKEGSCEALTQSVESLIKPAIYTPETKKISLLLQEFRNKQIHLAIVVDEYGGTEGIVTIEDILEELVGEIEDEYDTQEERNYTPLSSGGWIVDAKMSIIDLEEDLGVNIPPSSEYDTIGGYIFHRAGSIPSAGWKAHLDDVDLEVLSSDPRFIRKIKVTPRNPILEKK